FNNSPGAPGKNPSMLADKPFGEWNKLRILQASNITTVYLNDKLVVDHAVMENYWERSLPLFPKGPIQLQTHGGEIRWRNLFIRELPSAEANAILSRRGEAGFKSVFDGKDFAGWAGPIENYEVKDGAIICKPHQGGTIYTQDEFSDFVAREFVLGGNGAALVRFADDGAIYTQDEFSDFVARVEFKLQPGG